MQYIDPYNFPELAVRQYTPVGGSVNPDLFHGTIFRVVAGSSFDLERLRNQIDGAKFFLEVYNTSLNTIYITLNSDYIDTVQNPIITARVDTFGVTYLEVVCRRGKMIVYDTVGVLPSPGGELQNPLGGTTIINPATGQPLLNPKR